MLIYNNGSVFWVSRYKILYYLKASILSSINCCKIFQCRYHNPLHSRRIQLHLVGQMYTKDIQLSTIIQMIKLISSYSSTYICNSKHTMKYKNHHIVGTNTGTSTKKKGFKFYGPKPFLLVKYMVRLAIAQLL